PERFNFNANVAIKSRTNQLQVIAPLSSAADDCFPRARLQPPRKKNHFLRGLQTRAIPAGVSHLPLQTTKIEVQNQVFNYNRIDCSVLCLLLKVLFSIRSRPGCRDPICSTET